MDVKVEGSEIKYKGRVLNVRQDHVRFPDGRTSDIDIVVHRGAVALIPVDTDGTLYFVEQYRHPTGGMLLELPAGTLEAGEEPETTAYREIREEIGKSAANIELLAQFYLAPGYSSEYMYVYLATGLQDDPLPGDEDEYLDVRTMTLVEAYRKLDNNEFADAKTIAALSLARKRLEG